MAKFIDSRKKNFTKYCHAINVFGKNILVKFLKWFYKGGNTNYLDYLMSEYDLSDMDHLVDASRRYDLRNKTPDEFDMTLIHVLLQLTCNLYEEKAPEDSNDHGYEFVERGVESLVMQYINTSRMKQSLSDSELEDKLYDLRKLYEKLIMTGGRLSGADQGEVQELFEETCLGVMCLNSYIEKFNPSFAKEKKVLYNEELVKKIDKIEQEAEKMTPTQGKTKKDMHAFYKDVLEHKFGAKALKFKKKLDSEKTIGKQTLMLQELSHVLEMDGDDDGEKTDCSSIKIQGDKASSKVTLGTTNLGTSPAEKPTSSKKTDPVEKVSSSCDSKIQSAVSQTESTNNISSTRQNIEENIVHTVVHNTNISSDKSSSSDDAISKDNARMTSMRSKICAALHDDKTNKNNPAGQGKLYFSDTHVFLKQHQKYSRRPGQQVKLKDMLNVEGMNDDVAEIIIVSGEAGMGKTMLMKYISEMWKYDQSAIEGLESRKMLFFTELRNNDYSNINDFIASILKNKVEILGKNTERLINAMVDMALEREILLILDGYDESAEKSCQLVKEVLQISGIDVRVIITSRPQYVDSIYRQIPKARRKHVSHSSLNGIPSPYHADFVSRFMDGHDIVILRDKSIKEEVKKGLIRRLPEIYEVIGEDLCNPLMLRIITFMWIENTGILDIL